MSGVEGDEAAEAELRVSKGVKVGRAVLWRVLHHPCQQVLRSVSVYGARQTASSATTALTAFMLPVDAAAVTRGWQTLAVCEPRPPIEIPLVSERRSPYKIPPLLYGSYRPHF